MPIHRTRSRKLRKNHNVQKQYGGDDDFCLLDYEPVGDRQHIKILGKTYCYVDFIESIYSDIPDALRDIANTAATKNRRIPYPLTPFQWTHKGIKRWWDNEMFTPEQIAAASKLITDNYPPDAPVLTYWFRRDPARRIYRTRGNSYEIAHHDVPRILRQHSVGGRYRNRKTKRRGKRIRISYRRSVN